VEVDLYILGSAVPLSARLATSRGWHHISVGDLDVSCREKVVYPSFFRRLQQIARQVDAGTFCGPTLEHVLGKIKVLSPQGSKINKATEKTDQRVSVSSCRIRLMTLSANFIRATRTYSSHSIVHDRRQGSRADNGLGAEEWA
jgi:hypothetical protein